MSFNFNTLGTSDSFQVSFSIDDLVNQFNAFTFSSDAHSGPATSGASSALVLESQQQEASLIAPQLDKMPSETLLLIVQFVADVEKRVFFRNKDIRSLLSTCRSLQNIKTENLDIFFTNRKDVACSLLHRSKGNVSDIPRSLRTLYIEHAPSLRQWRLSGLQINHSKMREIFKDVHTVDKLELSTCTLTHTAFRDHQFDRIDTLCFIRCTSADDAALDIRSIVGSKLPAKTVIFQGCDWVTPVGLKSLSKMDGLRRICIINCPKISAQDSQRLRQAGAPIQHRAPARFVLR